jgi:predicted signal transduction protein with EAL and GGDEF domain
MEPVATAAELSPGDLVDKTDNQIGHGGQNRSAAICTAVQTALRQNRLLFAFQPVVCAATGETDYFECLLRMRDVGGASSPAANSSRRSNNWV